MVVKERVAKSQIHLYINKYLSQGYVKVSDKKRPYIYMVTLERRSGKKVERLTFKYTQNGWLTIF